MPVLHATPQQPSWDSNIYVQTITRIFVMVGVGYLVRSLYSQVSSTWGPRPASIAAGERTCPSSIR